ncbi:MAG TPA: thymidine kinase [Polyangiaceae bacterium]
MQIGHAPKVSDEMWDGSKGTVGCIEVVCGSMFSGKTEELLRRVKRAKYARLQTVVFKPKVDDRYDEVKVVTHEGLSTEAVPIASSGDMLALVGPNVAVVGVDEVQFFDEAVVDVVEELANRGVRVICAGLDQDYRGMPFGPMPRLLAVAEHVTKLHAVCMRCGREASRSQRLVAMEGQLFVGGAAAYEARCRKCFVAKAVEP